MKILIVEDEAKTSEYLRQGLTEAGFVVDLARNGLDGHHLAMTEQYDLIILDVMLADVDGWRILESVRATGSMVPVLFLTARDSVNDRVKGLELGADDYLVKPFAFAELLARLRALTRREPAVLGTLLHVGDLIFDTLTQEVSRQGMRLELTTKEGRLLEYLMRHPNHVLTRTMIAEHVWNYDFDNATNVIDVHVRNLRRKIDAPFTVKLLQTIRGAGYRISAGPSE